MVQNSKVTFDWVTKGCHIHVGPVELAVRPGQNGGIVFKKVFASISDPDAKTAVQQATAWLKKPANSPNRHQHWERSGPRRRWSSCGFDPGVNQASKRMKSQVLSLLFLALIPNRPAWAANARSMTINQMAQIHSAIWTCFDVEKRFPTDILDPKGKPLLSWRVRLLPYLEEDRLFKKFHLDEPWDSPHNLQLAEKAPSAFHYLYSDSDDGKSFFSIPTDLAAWLGPMPSWRVRNLQLDKTKTIILVELAEGIPWSKPGDWTPNPNDPFQGLARNHRISPLLEPGCFVSCTDEKVRFLSPTAPKETLVGMLKPAENDYPWSPSWLDLFSTYPRPGGPMLALPLAFLLGAWGCFVLIRLVRHWSITPGEWLSLVVAAQQVTFAINFIRLFEFEWVPTALYRDQHWGAFCRMPWAIGLGICLVAMA